MAVPVAPADRHGTCAQPLLGDRAAFFKTVVGLNQKFDLGVSFELCFAALLGRARARSQPLRCRIGGSSLRLLHGSLPRSAAARLCYLARPPACRPCPQAALLAKGISPSATAAYPAATLQSAVAAAYGASPVLKCNTRGAVQELWMCLGLDLSPRPCPPHVRGDCPPRVHLPLGAPVRAGTAPGVWAGRGGEVWEAGCCCCCYCFGGRLPLGWGAFEGSVDGRWAGSGPARPSGARRGCGCLLPLPAGLCELQEVFPARGRVREPAASRLCALRLRRRGGAGGSCRGQHAGSGAPPTQARCSVWGRHGICRPGVRV